MKWKMVKKGNKWVRRPSLEVDEWVTLVIVVLTVDYILLRLIING